MLVSDRLKIFGCTPKEEVSNELQFKAFDGMQVIKVDNIDRYLNSIDYEYPIKKHISGEYKLTDFPNISPPFPKLVMEYFDQDIDAEFGITFYASDTKSKDSSMDGFGANEIMENRGFINKFNSKWFVSSQIYIRKPNSINDYMVGPFATAHYFVDDDGKYRCPHHNKSGGKYVDYRLVVCISEGYQETGIDLSNLMARKLALCFFSLSLMHCKNVQVVENTQPRPVRRRAFKDHNHKVCMYKTLNVGMVDRLNRGNSIEGNGQNPLHICRGHFKTFTDEAPLMGRHTGTYWWDAQVRGSRKHGEVVKNYNVQP